MNPETSYHINQNDEQRMKTQGSDIKGKENQKSSNLNSEHKTKTGPTEDQAKMNKDVENNEDAKIIIIKPNYEDTKGSFTLSKTYGVPETSRTAEGNDKKKN